MRIRIGMMDEYTVQAGSLRLNDQYQRCNASETSSVRKYHESWLATNFLKKLNEIQSTTTKRVGVAGTISSHLP